MKDTQGGNLDAKGWIPDPALPELDVSSPYQTAAVQWVTPPTGYPAIDEAALILGGLAQQAIANVGPPVNLTRMDVSGGISAAVYGTFVHTEFARLVRGAGIAGISPAEVETSFAAGEIVTSGYAGSIRTDVVLRAGVGPGAPIIAIFDLKTGVSGMTESRAAQLRANVSGATATTPVVVIKMTGLFAR